MDQQNEKSEKTKQIDKSVDTHDLDSLRGYQRSVSNGNFKSHLWCIIFCKKKKPPVLHVRKPKRRFLKRIIKRSKESEKVNEAASAVPGISHRESITSRTDPTKSRKSPKQDVPMELTDKVSEEAGKEKQARKEETEKKEEEKEKRKKKKKERKEEEREKKKEEKEKAKEEKREKKRKERKEEEMDQEEQDKKERKQKARQVGIEEFKDEEKIPYSVDMHQTAHNEQFVKDYVTSMKLPSDLTKTCCYLCAQNTLAIAAAASKVEKFDKSIQVMTHDLLAKVPMLDKSCSAILPVRTVQSYVKVKTRETSTLCPGAKRKDEKATKRKFYIFPKLTWTKCPAGRNAACVTDNSVRRDNTEKHEPRNERCCRAKMHNKRI